MGPVVDPRIKPLDAKISLLYIEYKGMATGHNLQAKQCYDQKLLWIGIFM